MEKCYISNMRKNRVELVKTLDKTESDPEAFRKSKLMKIERICVTSDFTNANNISTSITESFVEPKTWEGILDSLFTRISDEEYNKVKNGLKEIIKKSRDEFEKLLPEIY